MDSIVVNNLKKKFIVRERKPGILGSIANLVTAKKKEITAVDDVSFTIKKGELVGYLGPNGAGKSTTIKMLTGILRPDSGQVSINGVNPVKNRKLLTKQIGVVFGQKTQLWWDLPVAESFDLLRVIYKIPRERYKKQLEVLFELLNLEDFWRQPTRQLSLGQRMRSDLGASLLHQPQVLFLDEPTIGLDILTRDAIRSFIKYLNQTLETTVILTTHDMQDIEFLANRLILLDRGSIRYDGQLDSFVNKYSTEKLVSIHLENETPLELLNSTSFEIVNRLSDRNFEVKMKADESVAFLIEAISGAGAKIREINVRKPELSDTLKLIYKGQKNLEL